MKINKWLAGVLDTMTKPEKTGGSKEDMSV
jgi:hypothetical protein